MQEALGVLATCVRCGWLGPVHRGEAMRSMKCPVVRFGGDDETPEDLAWARAAVGWLKVWRAYGTTVEPPAVGAPGSGPTEPRPGVLVRACRAHLLAPTVPAFCVWCCGKPPRQAAAARWALGLCPGPVPMGEALRRLVDALALVGVDLWLHALLIENLVHSADSMPASQQRFP